MNFQLFRLPELQLHAMACQGVGLNGGEGGNLVNPMDVRNLSIQEIHPSLTRYRADVRPATVWFRTSSLMSTGRPVGPKVTQKGYFLCLFEFKSSTPFSQRVATPMENRKRKYGADAARFSTVPKK